jgi:hypothetical protein
MRAAIMTQGRRYSTLCSLMLVAFPLEALATPDQTVADSSSSDSDELRRELAGHNFIPSRFSLDPFVQTSVAAETGFGYGWAKGRTFNIQGQPVSVDDYSVGAFDQLLEYQYGFLPWWAVRIDLDVLVYSGLNASGAIGVGTNIGATGGLGTTMSWKVGENLRLGGSVDFDFGPSVFLNLVESVVNSISAGQIVSPVNSFSQYILKPAFVGAWTIVRPLGLTFSLAYQYTHYSSSSAGSKTNLVMSNAVFDFDMAKLNWVPIGLLAGFQTSFSADSTAFLQFRWQFGIFYTGVRNLNVGVEIVYQRAPVVGGTEIFLSSLQALIGLQYNFN